MTVLAIGQVLKGWAASYQVTRVLKEPTVLQAKGIPFDRSRASQPLQLYGQTIIYYVTILQDSILA